MKQDDVAFAYRQWAASVDDPWLRAEIRRLALGAFDDDPDEGMVSPVSDDWVWRSGAWQYEGEGEPDTDTFKEAMWALSGEDEDDYSEESFA